MTDEQKMLNIVRYLIEDNSEDYVQFNQDTT